MRADRPQHVTLRLREGVPTLRRARAFRAVRSAIRDAHKEGFAIVHFVALRTHLHLMIEARDRVCLSRGVQGLKIRLTLRLNALFGLRGTIFGDRFHAQEIATPRQARAALGYVLGNARKHAAERGRVMPQRWVDPFSSARQFDGWRQPVRREDGVVRPARTWLLRAGWKRHGLLDAHSVPASGPPRGADRTEAR